MTKRTGSFDCSRYQEVKNLVSRPEKPGAWVKTAIEPKAPQWIIKDDTNPSFWRKAWNRICFWRD